jgi:hypothetical protein
MDFQEAKRRHAGLNTQLEANRLRYDEYVAAVQEIRVCDGQGYWWTIDPDSGGWLRWDGSAWSPDQPPAEADAGPGFCANCQRPLTPGRKFCTMCRTPVAGVPQSPRVSDQAAACPSCGTPISTKLKFCQRCGTVLASPAAPAQRREPAEPENRRTLWSQRTWDTLAILAGFAMAYKWLILTGGHKPEDGGQPVGVDVPTCLAVGGLPLILVVFRSMVDRMLAPLQVIRRKIPPFVLLGAGLLMPSLASNLFGQAEGRDQLRVVPITFSVGLLASYAVLRNPVEKGRYK